MITGNMLRDAIISGTNNILKYKKEINDLNIFPVPDGDTGTNMSLTMQAGAAAVSELSDDASVGEVSKKAASAMLRGARGNSGVILSLLFKGLSKGMADLDTINSAELIDSLDIGVEDAYSAVMNPTEGTILTVARVSAERGREEIELDDQCIAVWDAVCVGAYDALEATPDLLPVLKRAGVVDAGGQGLCKIFDGMMSVFKDGVIIETKKTEEERSLEVDEFFRNAAAEFDSEITFTYCTEFVIDRDNNSSSTPQELRDFLESLGDSVVVAEDEEIIKVHVHTENPGLALEEALNFGQLITVKIDNMKEQHRIASEENEAMKEVTAQEQSCEEKIELQPKDPVEEMGFVSIAAGDGLQGLFIDLGASVVVSGGQTMNPSTQDIVQAITATPAKTVFVLPNNKNILLAAEQTVPLVTDREVIIVPTRTIPQGISAMLAYDPDETVENNVEEMSIASSKVSTGHVTFAARDSEFDGHDIKQGQILGLENGKLNHLEKDPITACMKVARSLLNRNTAFLTLIYGEGITADQAEMAKDMILAKTRTNAEINIVKGDQPLYYFIISVE